LQKQFAKLFWEFVNLRAAGGHARLLRCDIPNTLYLLRLKEILWKIFRLSALSFSPTVWRQSQLCSQLFLFRRKLAGMAVAKIDVKLM